VLYLATVQTITGVVPWSTMVILDLVTLHMHTVEVITRTLTLIGVNSMDGTHVIGLCRLITPCLITPFVESCTGVIHVKVSDF